MTQPNPINELPNINALAAVLAGEKARLHQAQENVRIAEQALAAAVGVKDEGSFTVALEHYKVTTTQPVRRTITADGARELQQQLPRDLADAIVDWKPTLSTKVYKDLEKYQPDTFRHVSRFVTSKPGKVSVKLELLELES